MMPCRRSLLVNRLISDDKITVSPLQSALPSLDIDSKLNIWGTSRNDLPRRPRTTGRIFVLDFITVHTPLADVCMPPRIRPNCSQVLWNEFAMDYPPYLRPRTMRDVNTRLANRTFLAKASGLSMASKWMYMSRGESNSQWLCVAVTLIPSLRRREIKGFSSVCKITVSPKHKALPRRSMLSKEYACGTNIKDSALRPKTIGLIFVRDRVAVHTPLITAGVAFNMAANLLHNSEGCILCIAIIITSRAIYAGAVDLHGMNI